MPRKPSNRPTDSELAILAVLWENGPCTVKNVHQILSEKDTTGYTTVLKTLQIMFDKQLVVRDASSRAHIYSAAQSQQKTQKHLLADLADRAFRGSAANMVLQALSNETASEDEIAEIRRLLDEMSEADK